MIDEPFQLSNYTVKQANRPFNVKGKSSSSHATDLATLTVQADGIHLLDIASQNTLQSFSTGPSTAFASAATTFVEELKDGNITRRTVALSGGSTKKQKVLSWRETLSASQAAHLGGQSQQEDFEIDGAAATLHPIPASPPTMLIGYPDGSYLYTHSDFTRIEQVKSDSHQRQLGEFVFAADNVPFLPKAEVARYVVLTVSQGNKDKSITINAYQVLNNAARALELLGNAIVPFEETIRSISASSTGQLHIVDRTNKFNSIEIQSINKNQLIYKHLSSISIKDTYNDLAVLGLKNSLALLVARKENQIVLTVWDTTLKIMLSEYEFAIPQSVGSSEVELELSDISVTSAMLAISSKSSKRSQAVVMVVPFSVPSQSTILAALGREQVTQKYLSKPSKGVQQKSASPLDPDQSKLQETLSLIEKIITDPQTDSEEATAVLNEYFKTENLRLRNIANELFRADLADAALESFGKDVDQKTIKEESMKNISTEPVLPRWFVKSLIELIFKNALKEKVSHSNKHEKVFEFQPSHYSRTLVSRLIWLHVISNDYAIYWGGILQALWKCKDAKSLIPAITQVGDIPEASLVSILKSEIALHRTQQEEQRKTKEDTDKMEVDGDSKTDQSSKSKGFEGFAQVDGVLKAVIMSDYTPGLMRRSFYEQFADGDDINRLFKKVEFWLHKEFTHPQTDISNISNKAQKDAIRERVKGIRAPKKYQLTLENLTRMAQVLLDAFFPILLHYEVSYYQVEKLNNTLKELTEREQAHADLRRLLETFAAKATATKDKLEPQMSVKAAKEEKRSLGVGSYAIEQFDLE
ncbi:hypothetical protein E3P81_01415 [Wallemia ichthyophaga]|nr:hypothetical protein E3P97_01416 [Wallemia ichthyophaga]TIB32163.1 hypothetical protein E3P85_01917 [Wallemia ichthyophaga]TIB47958.1 hypothetical protein E3P82_01414 [Wallemia ichthyophaga]TIB52182.1 hypothetical protein E3P81_01415 [Wallemia ichthyophaga]TIB54968.1 hypothetical protein E3P80_01415 [Wallemia ichthyophaga]